ncbi:MAG: carotenoid biosynthesis protein, partial [Nanoarchaeota archaeon]|nr:carotenoid biosynthesis protein [Nanoarchaeota archaeon]
MNVYFAVVEIFVYLMFILLVALQFKKPKKYRKTHILFAGLAFGLILEIFNIMIWHTYSYGNVFLIYIHGIPLGIGAAWAVILHIAMTVSNRIGKAHQIPEFVLPFVDALMVMSFDIVLDVLAVRYGGWNWLIPSSVEWFGVPYENFAGWIFVALAFSIIVRFSSIIEKVVLLRKKPKIIIRLTRLLIPVTSYMLLLLIFIPCTILINTIYLIKNYNVSGLTTLSIKKFLAHDPTIVYDVWISQIKEIMFILLLVAMLVVVLYYFVKRGVLSAENLKIEKKYQNFKK